MQIQPTGNRVLVVPDPLKKHSSGGILLPGEQRDLFGMGVILDVGEGRVLDSGSLLAVPYKVGQHIAFLKEGTLSLEYGNASGVIVSVGGILAILEDEEGVDVVRPSRGADIKQG